MIVREKTRRHMGYSFRLTARVLLYTPSHRQDSTYHGLCYTSRGALAGTRSHYTSAVPQYYVWPEFRISRTSLNPQYYLDKSFVMLMQYFTKPLNSYD